MELRKLKIRGQDIEVSKCGKVVYRNGELANQNENHDGYLVVGINNRNIGIHRLVAMAFIDNPLPESKIEVNHKDFNRQNNHMDNLEWMTHVENIRYSHQEGRYPKRYGEENPNYGNTKLSEFYKDNPDIALEKQSRKGIVNGRATPIELLKDGILVKRFNYIGECCEYLHLNHNFSSNPETIRIGIRRSIKSNIPYKGFTFKK